MSRYHYYLHITDVKIKKQNHCIFCPRLERQFGLQRCPLSHRPHVARYRTAWWGGERVIIIVHSRGFNVCVYPFKHGALSLFAWGSETKSYQEPYFLRPFQLELFSLKPAEALGPRCTPTPSSHSVFTHTKCFYLRGLCPITPIPGPLPDLFAPGLTEKLLTSLSHGG